MHCYFVHDATTLNNLLLSILRISWQWMVGIHSCVTLVWCFTDVSIPMRECGNSWIPFFLLSAMPMFISRSLVRWNMLLRQPNVHISGPCIFVWELLYRKSISFEYHFNMKFLFGVIIKRLICTNHIFLPIAVVTILIMSQWFVL